MQGVGCRVQDAGCKVQGAGCRVQGAGCRVQGAGCRVQGARCRVQGAGCREQGAGLSVERYPMGGGGLKVQTVTLALSTAGEDRPGVVTPPTPHTPQTPPTPHTPYTPPCHQEALGSSKTWAYYSRYAVFPHQERTVLAEYTAPKAGYALIHAGRQVSTSLPLSLSLSLVLALYLSLPLSPSLSLSHGVK
ncbi:hypothetical protein T484DRAFT_3392600 [Baffinella frigidus]|nr:hypothetical protein T484DRAFT_3392600 [Cryptophyta sp. CCMP2293]